MQQVSLYLKTNLPSKRVSKHIIQLINLNYYKGKSKNEIADMFSLKIRTVYNIRFLVERRATILERIYRQSKKADLAK